MLPEYLKSSYHRYKTDTEKFTFWLVRTAAQLGVFVGDESNGTQKNPKNAKTEPPKQILSMAKYRELVNTVVGNGISLPKSIEAFLRRAILIRKRCAVVFQKTSTDDDCNSRHQHFIDVMEDAHRRLSTVERKPDQNKTADKEITVGDSSNRFKILTPSSSSQKEKSNQLSPSISKTKPLAKSKSNKTSGSNKSSTSSKPKSQPILEFKIENEYDKDISEPFFIVYCLLLDLNRIRDYIKELWVEYKDGKLDAMTAGVTTNVAVVLGYKLIEEANTSLTAAGSSISSLYNVLFFALAGSLLAMSSKTSATQNQCPTHQTAIKLDGNDSSSQVENIGCSDWNFSAVEYMLISFAPFIKQRYKPSADLEAPYTTVELPRDHQETLESIIKNRELLKGLFREYIFEGDNQVYPWAYDEISRRFLDYIVRPDFQHLETKFAAMVSLDVINTLGEKSSRPWDELRLTVLRLQKYLNVYLTWMANVEIDDRILDTHKAEEFLKVINQHLTQDQVAAKKAKMWPKYKFVEFQCFKQNPVLASWNIYMLNVLMHHVGIFSLRSLGPIANLTPTLYLYNLLKMSPSLPTMNWKDLDEFLHLQDESGIFMGRRPNDIHESYSRLEICYGISPVQYARNRRFKANSTQDHVRLSKGPRILYPTAPLATVAYGSIFSSSSAPLPLVLVEKMIQCLESDPKMLSVLGKSPEDTNPLQFLKQKSTSLESSSPLEILAMMRNHLVSEEPLILFNYLGLNQRVYDFTCKLRLRFRSFLVFEMPDVESDSDLPFTVYHIMRAVSESQTPDAPIRLVPPTNTDKMLGWANEVMNEYVRLFGDIACKELKAFSNVYKAAQLKTLEEQKDSPESTQLEGKMDLQP
ncbi:hypothetical protein TWF694_005179 [Orbilia ellipsospora]|uniref:DUF6604 domain-containing protein n=1 Tax=Orbilia ellipsospora TaxID=2528407 RepID=A0AAV9X0Y9_9PEZI